MPQQIEKQGFSKYEMVKYTNDLGIQYYTFLNWMTKDPNDTVIFVLSRGQIIEIIKENSKGVVRQKIDIP